jgi:leucyl-tRNA synthetase
MWCKNSYTNNHFFFIFSFQTVPVPDNELPVRLPSIENIKSSSKKGISPLANAHDWIKTQCPK